VLTYSAFGLTVAADRPVPGLIPLPTVRPPQVWIRLATDSPFHGVCDSPHDLWYISEDTDAGTPSLRVWKLSDGRYFRLLYADGTEFFVDSGGQEVWAFWPATSTLEDTSIYLLGPVLGFLLRLRGITCLHASAVSIGKCAIALAGPAEAGKSTLAAAFTMLGYPVLSDDVTALVPMQGVVCVQPAYPQVRLWPDAVARMFGSDDVLPRLTPTWDKRALDLSQAGRFQRESLPLAAIYVLDSRMPDASPRIDGMRGREALRVLLPNSYVGYLLTPLMREQEFGVLADLVSKVPIRRVAPSEDPSRLAQLCECILDDCEALGCTASPTTGP
jgi:hypothetical protein